MYRFPIMYFHSYLKEPNVGFFVRREMEKKRMKFMILFPRNTSRAFELKKYCEKVSRFDSNDIFSDLDVEGKVSIFKFK